MNRLFPKGLTALFVFALVSCSSQEIPIEGTWLRIAPESADSIFVHFSDDGMASWNNIQPNYSVPYKLKGQEMSFSNSRQLYTLKISNDTLELIELQSLSLNPSTAYVRVNDRFKPVVLKEQIMETYYESGELKQTAEYRNGLLHGRLVKYDKTGNITSTATFKNGSLVSTSSK